MMADPSDWLISKMPKLAAIYEFRYDVRRDIDKVLENPEDFERAEHPTIYQHLPAVPEEKGAKWELTREELMQEAITLLTLLSAGSDTVGNTATVGTFYVLEYKVVHGRPKTELHANWADLGVNVDYTTLEKLPYLVSYCNCTLIGGG
jgi:cytochrome P450